MTRGRVALRLAGFYIAIFTAVGIHIPFWPLWLKDRGLSATEIGLIAASAYLVKLVVNPLVGHVVDHRGDRKRPMIALALAAGLAWMVFPALHGFPALLVWTVIAVAPFTSLMPVGDSLAMMVVAQHRLDYGRVRLWGSLAFIAAAALVGRALADWPVTALPWLLAVALLLTAASCVALPDARVPPHDAPPPPLGPLLSSRPFLLFLAATALTQAGHTVYYAFATINWRQAGLSDATIGLLWSEGVVAEIVLFALSNRVVGRIGPVPLLLLAGLGGVLRWTLLGASADLMVVIPAQLLHAATFGCSHLGAMHFLQRAVAPRLAVRAQGLYAAIAVGLVPGLVTPLSGALYDRIGGQAFLAMALLAAGAAALSWKLARTWDGGRLEAP